MKYLSDGYFELDAGDWTAIITWPSHNYTGVAEWETPMFTADVARWLASRNVGNGTIKLITNPNHRYIKITDRNLALEFKLRWCRKYPEVFDKRQVWCFCNEAAL